MDERRIVRLETMVERHDHHIRGNGEPGLISIVRENTKQLAAMDERLDGIVTGQADLKESLDALVLERRDADQQRLGQVKLFNGVRTALIILSFIVGIGAPLGMWKISAQWTQVQNQIERIPALPE